MEGGGGGGGGGDGVIYLFHTFMAIVQLHVRTHTLYIMMVLKD